MKVTPLSRPAANNMEKIYYDFYPPIYNPNTGSFTRRESSNLFVPSKFVHVREQYIDTNGKQRTRIVRAKNKNGKVKKRKLTLSEKVHYENNWAVAKHEASQKQMAIINEQYEVPNKSKSNSNFIKYFEKMVEKQENSNTYANWKSCLNYLKDFAGNNVPFKTVTKRFCEEFRDHLEKANSLRRPTRKLLPGSANSYFIKFRSVIKQAYEEGYLQKNMIKGIKPIGEENTIKDYLTMEELQKLVETPFKYPILKSALLFAAMTGLRVSDIKSMQWGDIRKNLSGYSYQFIQKKMKRKETIPLNYTAVLLLGSEKDPNEFVFAGMKEHVNDKIKEWIRSAGIDKKITWHNFRHSFSSNLAEVGVDFYTIMNLLTQRGSLKQLPVTYRYTHLSEKHLREASNKLSLDLSKLV